MSAQQKKAQNEIENRITQKRLILTQNCRFRLNTYILTQKNLKDFFSHKNTIFESKSFFPKKLSFCKKMRTLGFEPQVSGSVYRLLAAGLK